MSFPPPPRPCPHCGLLHLLHSVYVGPDLRTITWTVVRPEDYTHFVAQRHQRARWFAALDHEEDAP